MPERTVAGEARIRRALWWSLGVLLTVVGGVITVLALRQARPAAEIDAAPSRPSRPALAAAVAPPLPFTDITASAGIDFPHHNGAYGERLLPETMGGGVAFFDYDNDGRQDLLLVNGTAWPGRPQVDARSRLYRNRGDGRFHDVTEAIGLGLRLYGMGVAAGDYDDDGFVDVFVTAVGENRLLRNVHGKGFEDVTEAAGVAGDPDAFSTCAAFLDYDGDGDLDLFVCNYVAWSPAIDRAVDFRLTGIGRAYGPPTDFPGTNSVLYRNDGGTFADVSAAAGIEVANAATGEPAGKALAVRPVDVDNDGDLDLAVANDTVRNFLFRNEGGGRFTEIGLATGFAFDATGSATGAMGIDAARYDNDPKLAIAIGNFANEMSSFYVARPGEAVFTDDAIVAGIGAPSRRALTFGLAFFDADLDGRLDLFAANGHVEPAIGSVQASQRYAQPAQLFWNCAARCAGGFALATATGALATPRVGRGAAYADIDGDGDLDLAITQPGLGAALLRNDQGLGNNYLRVALRKDAGNRFAIGAVVTATVGDLEHTRTVMPTRSYLSQVELPLTFGLGEARQVDRLDVRWPGGETETWTDLIAGRTHRLTAGQGRVTRTK